jgi:isopenicillin N synthase-like dioxygenase
MSVVGQPEILPTLDLRRFNAGGAERAAFLSELRGAAGGVRFFYLIGHGVEETLVSGSAGTFNSRRTTRATPTSTRPW